MAKCLKTYLCNSYYLKILGKTEKMTMPLILITKWLGNHSIVHYQIRMVIMMIDSTLKPSDIDKPTQQLSSCFSSADLENTPTLWLTGKIWDCH